MGPRTAPGPFGRHILTLAAAALGLAALAACQPPSSVDASAHQTGSTATRATARAVDGATPTPGATAAVPGRPGSYSRAPLGVLAATFISPRTGWALGVRSCHHRRCRIELRKTTDYGRRWFPVPAPPAPYAWPGSTPPGAVANVRFADERDGWAFGPGLWSTHNAGRTWREVSLQGGLVQSLAAGGGRVIAAVAPPCSSSSQCGRYRVYSSPVTRDRWRPLPGASGTGGGPTGPQVTVAAGMGFATGTALDYGGGVPQAMLLTGPADGSARWHRLSTPCSQRLSTTVQVAATPGLFLILGCAGEPGAGSQSKRAYASADGGQTWARLAGPPGVGYLGTVSITPAGTILLSGGRSDVWVSWDGGRRWHGTANTSPSMKLAYQGGETLSAAMTTDTQGFTIEPLTTGGKIWFTYDDAHTWHLVTLH